jgi:hypothetical protein
LQHKEFKQNKESFQFTLVEFDAGNMRRVICQCKDDEQYELWVTSVNKVLQRQMDLITGRKHDFVFSQSSTNDIDMLSTNGKTYSLTHGQNDEHVRLDCYGICCPFLSSF